MSSSSKWPILASLAMTCAFGIISGGVGLNALVKSNQQQSRLRAKVPSPTVLDINIKDVENSGIVLTTVAALIALLTFLMILYHLFMSKNSRGSRMPLLQSAALGFCTVWLLAAQIPFTLFFATRSAKVRAFVGGVELPAQVVHSVEKALGATSVYKDIGYLRLVAVIPWFLILFATISTVLLFTASGQTSESKYEQRTRDNHSSFENGGTTEPPSVEGKEGAN